MSDGTKLGLAVLGAALLMGALGDALLRAMPWGLNVPLWVACLAAAAVAVARWGRVGLDGGGRWLIGPALFFAAAVAWRDSAVMGTLNTLAALVALALAAFRARAGRVRIAGLAEYARGLALAVAEAAGGLLALVSINIRWREIPRGGWSNRLLEVGRGLAIAVPLVLVFGGLFAAADAAFAGILRRLFGWDLSEMAGHVIVAGCWAWIVAGYLRRLLIVGEGGGTGDGGRALGWLGPVETGIVLGLLNALFLAFVLVQFRYLFGGAALVEASADLTYAEYARRGFFELVTVAALVLPLLLLLDWVARREGAREEHVFRALVGVLVALLFVIMVSAVQRMRLYQEEFGLTELRLYTTAFMGWLALVFVWFLLTVLRGRRERFAFGALVAGFAVVGLLDGLNPDGLIVGVSAARPAAPRPFDSRYATSLSADAVPALVEALPALPESERGMVSARILKRWSPPEQPDWRTWNWGRARAWQAASVIEASSGGPVVDR